jgi:hypothetical protein
MKKFLSLSLLAVLILGVLTVLFLYYVSYSEGVRAGTVIKLSKKGVVFKTWEGQLDLKSFGAVKSSNQLSEVFEFSVEKGNDSLYMALEEVSLSGERINLYYVERYAVLPWRGSTKYFVTKVDRSGKVKEEKNGLFEK